MLSVKSRFVVPGLVAAYLLLSAAPSEAHASCNKYIITGIENVSIEESRANAGGGVHVVREVELPPEGADTAFVALHAFLLSFMPYAPILTLPDTSRLWVPLEYLDRHFGSEMVNATFDGFSGDKARIRFQAILTDKDGFDQFHVMIRASVMFLKCCDVQCAGDKPDVVFDPNVVRTKFGELNDTILKLQERITRLEALRR